jgi:hypothetical protein
MEYSTTGQAGGYMTDGAPESAHQPAQRLFGSYYAPFPKTAYISVWLRNFPLVYRNVLQ